MWEVALWELILWEVDFVEVDLVRVDLVRVDLVGINHMLFFFSCGKLVNDLHRSSSTCMHTLTF